METTNKNLEKSANDLIAITKGLKPGEKRALQPDEIIILEKYFDNPTQIIRDDNSYEIETSSGAESFYFEEYRFRMYDRSETIFRFSDDIILKLIRNNTTDSEIFEWAYNASAQGMADGVVHFNVETCQFSTAYYTTGSFDVSAVNVEICRADQNLEANSEFDLINDAVGNYPEEMIEYFEEEREDDEDKIEFLHRMYDEEPDRFNSKLKELSGEDVEEWETIYLCEDVEIDWNSIDLS